MDRIDRRPKIALPLRHEGVERCYQNYFETLEAAGAQPVDVWEDFEADGFDGLLLPGGGDVDPAFYRQENRGSGAIDRDLDEHQLAALDAMVKRRVPVLGVCRGHQLINVYFGGTLIQDLPTREHHVRGSQGDNVNHTTARPDSFPGRLYGGEFSVNSSHHQAVDAAGAGLTISQWAVDGVVEGMYHICLPVYGVQWHPERMCLSRARADTVDGMALFRWFVDLCAQRR